MASSLHTINADEVDSTSSQTDWGTESAFCPWISTHCPPPASFAAQRSPSIHSQYSAAVQLSPDPGPGTLVTPASTQQDHGGVSWVGSSSSSQYSPSNNGTGEISWMNIIGSPEFNPTSSAQNIAQPHSTDTTICQHHVHTQERSSTSAELKQYSRFKCHWKGCTYPGTFSRETCLWRHIKSTHVSPDEFKCPDSQCNKTFGRKDRFQSHMRSAHTSHVKGDCCSSCRS